VNLSTCLGEGPGIGRLYCRLSARLFVFLALLTLSILLEGCGFWIRSGIMPPESPPPSGPPPTSGQGGTVTITPHYVALAPGQKFQFAATASGGGQIEWLVNGAVGGSKTAGSIDTRGNFTAPGASGVGQSENITVTAALASSPQQNYATAVVALLLPAQILCPPFTGNTQVASYSIYLPAPGKAFVEFGKSTSYGQNTWQVATTSPNGGQVQIYVAGMLANSKYHLRGQITLDNGATFTDSDQTCNTGEAPPTAPVKVTMPNGGTPQPGIEMWNTLIPQNLTQAFATDLAGNVIWTYTYKGASSDLLQGIQLLPNGHLLILVSYLSSISPVLTENLLNEVREVDLAGNTVRSLTMDTLNQSLAASNLRDADGNLYQLKSFHHSVLVLPNGHWILLAAYAKNYTNLPGYPGTTSVIGDALVDVDQNLNPVWVWNTFDNLDVNRHPMNFPDWTHSNDMLYSTDDHNLLLSVRHQNWIIKIEYLDGQGSGKILWRLGEGGDFKLIGGADPQDWFYAQHGMSYFTQNTTGVFRMGLMDNGNDRMFPSGAVYCRPSPMPTATCYSTVPLLELNESNRTATMIAHYMPGPSYFSYFGGNVDQLVDGDLQANFCSPTAGAIVQELDSTASHVVWQGTTANADQFRVTRMPSLYPGVQW
jgi:arylsulfate sulfotransferase